MKTVNIVLMGFGNVGRAFTRIVRDKQSLYRKRYGINVQMKSIFEQGGALFISQSSVLDAILEKKGPQLAESGHWKSGVKLEEMLKSGEPGVLVECTPSNLETGEPGLTHIMNALDSGWHVVTANKGPLVVDFRRLFRKAMKKGLAIGFSGATAAALPALDIGLHALAGTEIQGIEGILNGTSNYILTRMTEGLKYPEALREAKDKGIAESDPSLDVDGWDTAAKLLLISNATAGTEFILSDIRVEGIKNLALDFVRREKNSPRVLKLLGRLRKKEGQYMAEVVLDFLAPDHPLFGVNGANKGITFMTDTMGSVTVTGGKSDPRGAGAALIKDIINIHRQKP
ncbi:MAG: homoserine dehydrogenase [Candidatus Aminicenantales bacterium]